MLKRFRILLLVIVIASIAGCGKDRYTIDEFFNRHQLLHHDNDIIELCRDYLDNVDDARFSLFIAGKWKEVDPEGVNDYLNEKMEAGKFASKYHMILGDLASDPLKRVLHGRKAVELSPVWLPGYELLLRTYSDSLFVLPSIYAKKHPLFGYLPVDVPLFDKFTTIEPKNQVVWWPAYKYRVFSKDYEGARAVLEKANSLPKTWVIPLHFAAELAAYLSLIHI